MPKLSRPDGATLHWEEAGGGPAAVISNTFNLGPVGGLVDTLSPARRVITYEPRGVGRSSRGGPYDMETGTADLGALLEETGPASVALGIGDGAHRALRAADARPDLIDRVVLTSASLGESGMPGFSGSEGVLGALMSLLRRDYRSGLRSMIASSAGDLDEETARQRVEELAETVPQEAAVGYIEAWIASDATGVARRLGDRLTVVAYPGNDWFPLAMYEALRDTLTEACFELVEDGPMARPELTAAVLLRVSERSTA